MPACIVPLLTDAYQHEAIAAIACQLYDSQPDVRLWVSGHYYAALTHRDIQTSIANTQAYTSLYACLDHWIETLRVPHTVWLVSDFNEPNYQASLQVASQCHSITPVFVDFTFDALCPTTGWQSVSKPNAPWFTTRMIHADSADLRARYQHSQSVNRSRLNYICQQLNLVPQWWV